MVWQSAKAKEPWKEVVKDEEDETSLDIFGDVRLERTVGVWE